MRTATVWKNKVWRVDFRLGHVQKHFADFVLYELASIAVQAWCEHGELPE